MKKDFVSMAAAIAKLYVGANASNLSDLIQEANLAMLEEMASLESKGKKPEKLKAYLRKTIHHRLKKYVRTGFFDGGLLSLDEEVGKDDDGDPVTRLDLIGVEAGQEDYVVQSEKRDLQVKVAFNRASALKKSPGSRQSRIDELLKLKSEGLTDKQIGNMLGISQQAVSKSLVKLRKKSAA